MPRFQILISFLRRHTRTPAHALRLLLMLILAPSFIDDAAIAHDAEVRAMPSQRHTPPHTAPRFRPYRPPRSARRISAQHIERALPARRYRASTRDALSTAFLRPLNAPNVQRQPPFPRAKSARASITSIGHAAPHVQRLHLRGLPVTKCHARFLFYDFTG